MSRASKPKKNYSQDVPLQRSGSDPEVPEENVLNLREVMLQREIERLQQKLDHRERRGLFGKVSNRWGELSQPKQKKVPAEIKMTDPEKTESAPQSKKRKPSIKFRAPRWKIERVHVKSWSGFMAAAFVLFLPIFAFWGYQHIVELRGKILDVSVRAFDQLVLAGEAATTSQYDEAQQKFAEASDSFRLAQNDLDSLGTSLLSLLKYVPFKGELISSGEHLLGAGQAVALAGQDITKVIELVNPEVADAAPSEPKNIARLLDESREYLLPAYTHVTEAVNHFKKIDPAVLPTEYQSEVARIKESLPELQDNFERFLKFSDVFYKVLGGEGEKRYLMIFQNNREMRATGGFIGSLALIDVLEGKITNLEIPGGGPYDFQGQLTEQVIAPAPLHLVNPHWYLQDANWFPDFPTSAEKIMWFYEKSGGPTVDGVISLTPDLVTSLLKITGSIDLEEEYGVTVTSENFIEKTLQEVEVEYDPETNKPKQFIADLMPILLDRLLTGDNQEFFAVLGALSESLQEKHLLMYLRDGSLQSQIEDLGWDGGITKTAGDYLMLVNTNIAGGKTDAVIDQSVKHSVALQANGEALASVEVTRLHNGFPGDPWTGVKNISFLRLYVPEGSELIEASGFVAPDPKLFQWPEPGYLPDADLRRIEGQVIVDERTGTRVNNEFGKTVFGNWVQVEPGASVTVKYTYRLPFHVVIDNLVNASAPYSLLIQKQPGSFDTLISSEISYPEEFSLAWRWPVDEIRQTDTYALQWSTILNQDAYFAVVFEQN
ncbi:MAG: DUF4012 domain-containing protein [bacterium]|nr:DUF4012 domain-containing protein [bacterium]